MGVRRGGREGAHSMFSHPSGKFCPPLEKSLQMAMNFKLHLRVSRNILNGPLKLGLHIRFSYMRLPHCSGIFYNLPWFCLIKVSNKKLQHNAENACKNRMCKRALRDDYLAHFHRLDGFSATIELVRSIDTTMVFFFLVVFFLLK